MATIRKRITKGGEARYEVQVRLAGQEPKTATFTRLKRAQDWAAEQEQDARDRRAFGRSRSIAHTLAAAIDRYLAEQLPHLSPTEQRVRRAILKWWQDRFGHFRLRDLEPDHFARVLAELQEAGKSPGTQNRYLSAVSKVLTVAVREWRWLGANPARQVTRRRERVGRVRFLSDAERERLLAACKDSRNRMLYPLVVVALATGARQGELLALDWQDVDLERLVVTFRDTKNRTDRTVPLSGPAVAVLESIGQRDGKCFGLRVFPKQAWLSALKRAQVIGFRFHDLRHTAASYLAMSGATPVELAAMLGHKTLAMVKRYAHLSKSHLAELAGRMADRFLSIERDEP